MSELKATEQQIGGDHYKSFVVQLAKFCHWNGIPKLEGDVIYYICRWRLKNGLQDLEKARHTIDLIIQQEKELQEHLVSRQKGS